MMLKDMRYTGLGFYALAGAMLQAISAMTGADAVHARHRFNREVRPRLRSISARSHRGPNGLTFHSLKRAVNAGWAPPQPDRKAMERHAWFQKKLHGARLRISVGQELPGDRELVAA